MTNRIQELTEKIYNEGVAKVKSDAEKIIQDAKNEATELIKSAKKQRDEILEKAQSEAAEMKKNAGAEMQLAARQFISNLKQKVENIIVAEQIEPPVKEAFSDTGFIKEIILSLVQNWNQQNPEGPDLQVVVPENKKDQFLNMLDERALQSMNKGIEIQTDAKLKTGFSIGPKDGSYFIRFSGEDFENYFKSYFKEKTRKLLFGEDEK